MPPTNRKISRLDIAKIVQREARKAALKAVQDYAQTMANTVAERVATQGPTASQPAGPSIEVIIDKAVTSSLEKLGIDTKNPDAMRADLEALRDWRETREMIRKKGIVTVTGIVVAFLFTAMATGVVVALKKFGVV